MNRQKFYQVVGLFGLALMVLMLSAHQLYAQGTSTISCKVNTSALNVRPGPGVQYKPVITTLARNTKLTGRAINPARTFLLIDVPNKSTPGWVALAYLVCTGDLKGLPVDAVVPLAGANSSTASGTSNNNATANNSAVVLKPDALYNPNNLNYAMFNPDKAANVAEGYEGIVEIPKIYLVNQSDPSLPIFNDRLLIKVLIGRPELPDDDSVGLVVFSLVTLKADGSDGEVVHTQKEETRPYCLFGDSERKCNTFYLAESNVWPQSKKPLRDGLFRADITATAQDGSLLAAWHFQFEIRRTATVNVEPSTPAPPAPPTPIPTPTPVPALAALQVELVQIGPGSLDPFVDGTLVFQVTAFDANVGTADGAGIQNVDLWIDDIDGNEVYHRTENLAHYCAFQGGEPDCNAFDLWSNDHWPNGPEIRGGPHTLYWRANAKDGSNLEGSIEIEIYR